MAKSGSQERHSDRPRRMHIISRKKLREFSVDHPDAEESLVQRRPHGPMA